MAVKLRKLSGPLLCSQLPWEQFWRFQQSYFGFIPCATETRGHWSERSLAKGGMDVAGGCSFFRNETRQMVFTDLTFCVAPLLSCQRRERWFCVCQSPHPLRSWRRGGKGKATAGKVWIQSQDSISWEYPPWNRKPAGAICSCRHGMHHAQSHGQALHYEIKPLPAAHPGHC